MKTTKRKVPVEIASHEATTKSMLIDSPEYDDPIVPKPIRLYIASANKTLENYLKRFQEVMPSSKYSLQEQLF